MNAQHAIDQVHLYSVSAMLILFYFPCSRKLVSMFRRNGGTEEWLRMLSKYYSYFNDKFLLYLTSNGVVGISFLPLTQAGNQSMVTRATVSCIGVAIDFKNSMPLMTSQANGVLEGHGSQI